MEHYPHAPNIPGWVKAGPIEEMNGRSALAQYRCRNTKNAWEPVPMKLTLGLSTAHFGSYPAMVCPREMDPETGTHCHYKKALEMNPHHAAIHPFFTRS